MVMNLLVIALFLVSIVFGLSLNPEQQTIHVAKESIFEHGHREYRELDLKNSLKVLLVSDPQAEKAEAALVVGSGSEDEPLEIPGLAHFCEHMVFMGNQKYPNENGLLEYAELNKGSANAYTDYGKTVYTFEVGHWALDEALEQFSNMFISPLFRNDSVYREAKAVNNEYLMKKLNSWLALEQSTNSFYRSNHPLSRFSYGNYDTLVSVPKRRGIDLRDAVGGYFSKYYSASNMHLVVIGREPLHQLKNMTISRFSEIGNSGIKPTWSGSPFTKKSGGMDLSIDFGGNLNNYLAISFGLPALRSIEEKWALDYVSHLFSNSGKNSLMEYINDQGLGTDFSTEINFEQEFSILHLTLTTTNYSQEDKELIIKLVFSYVDAVKKKALEKKRLDGFLQTNGNSVPEDAEELALELHDGNSARDIMGRNFMYNKTIVRELLDCMTPDNLRVVSINDLAGEGFVEDHWGSKYLVSYLPQSLMMELESIKASDYKLALSDVKPKSTKSSKKTSMVQVTKPVNMSLLSNSTNSLLWYLEGIQDNLADINLIVRPYKATPSVANTCQILIMQIYIQQFTSHETFQEDFPDIDFDVFHEGQGIYVKIKGPQKHIKFSVQRLLHSIVNHGIFSETFSDYTKVIQKAADYVVERKFKSSIDSKRNLFEPLDPDFWSDEAMLDQLDSTSEEAFITYYTEFLSSMSLEILAFGNISSSLAREVFEIANQLVEPSAEIIFNEPPRAVPFSGDHVISFHIAEASEINSMLTFYLDFTWLDQSHDLAILEFVQHTVASPFYRQLRTKEQLAYDLSTDSISAPSRGISFFILGPRHPIDFESRVEAFLETFVNETSAMSTEEYNWKLSTLIKSKEVEKGSNSKGAIWYLKKILSGKRNFNQDNEVLDQLRNLDQSKVVDFMKKYLLKSSPMRSKISMHHILQEANPMVSTSGTSIGTCGEMFWNQDIWKMGWLNTWQ